MKKQFIILNDTETTQTNKVADFAAVVCDRKGNIVAQCAVLINGVFNDRENHPLFFTSDKEGIWSKAGQDKRYDTYMSMLDSGTRVLASVNAVNRWLEKVKVQYNPILTAYNLPFDVSKTKQTGIDLSIFSESFCLWAAAFSQYAHTKKYRRFVLECHGFTNRTELGSMSIKTNAEIMARFVLNNMALDDEDHTALEDIIYYELPILKRILKCRSMKWLLNDIKAYDWRKLQVKDWFKPI